MNSRVQLIKLIDSSDLDIGELHFNSESLNISFNFLVGQLRNLMNSKSRCRYIYNLNACIFIKNT